MTVDTLYVSKSDKLTLVSFYELSNYGSLNTFEVVDDNRMIDYNYSIDGIGVWRDSAVIVGDQVKVVSGFEDFLCYGGYIGVTCFTGTVEDALVAFDFNNYDGEYKDYKSGEVVSAETIASKKDLYVVIIDQEIELEIKGKILYYSDNIELKDENSVHTASNGLCYIIFK